MFQRWQFATSKTISIEMDYPKALADRILRCKQLAALKFVPNQAASSALVRSIH